MTAPLRQTSSQDSHNHGNPPPNGHLHHTVSTLPPWKCLTIAALLAFAVSQVSEIIFLSSSIRDDRMLESYVVASQATQQLSLQQGVALAENTRRNNTTKHFETYKPSPVEEYILTHTASLGYDRDDDPSACDVWKNATLTPINHDLELLYSELEGYSKLIADFAGVDGDIRLLLEERSESQDAFCKRLELHPDGLLGIFPSQQLSVTRAGYVEPLLPPLRHAHMCMADPQELMDGEERMRSVLRMDYLVHDFGAMCRALRPKTRIVLLDMGASLDFHQGLQSPAMYILELYSKFGFMFDHIYAFEVTDKHAKDVYSAVPDNLLASYHWINVGIQPDPESPYNPLYRILKKFHKDDLIVVKLDVDTPQVEISMARQILNDPQLSDMVDQFYFEHHVHMAEMKQYWGNSMNGTIRDSLQLFRDLREKGVAAHFWP